MAGSAELERRVRVLQDIEAIKKLKAKYWRCIDRKLWEEITSCFTEDAVADYAPEVKPRGREAILKWLKDFHRQGVTTAHAGHNPEIEITSDTEATGIWAIHVYIVRQPKTKMRAWSHYEDKYVKEDGQWKIRSTKTVPVFVETMQMES
jgi:uncharacterized protein (TIGR02246 family)